VAAADEPKSVTDVEAAGAEETTEGTVMSFDPGDSKYS
jgi:hypothetical protein